MLCKNSYEISNSTSNVLDYLNIKHYITLDWDYTLSKNEAGEDYVKAPDN